MFETTAYGEIRIKVAYLLLFCILVAILAGRAVALCGGKGAV